MVPDRVALTISLHKPVWLMLKYGYFTPLTLEHVNIYKMISCNNIINVCLLRRLGDHYVSLHEPATMCGYGISAMTRSESLDRTVLGLRS
jgi:hypothetical protein